MIKMPLDEVFKIYEQQAAKEGLSLRPGWQQCLINDLKNSDNTAKISGNIVMKFDPAQGLIWLAEEKDKTNIYYYFKKDYSFSEEIITRYFLSLKTKPFIILTGISGTGKTKIAQIFANYMCQDDKSQIAFVPVRPDWMDNRGLLGYFNPLNECYHATPTLHLLLAAKQNPNKPYFLILDEMNLAKVEYYFSDFLSILETRTASDSDGESLLLHDLEEVAAYGNDSLKIPGKLKIPSNIYITGTVNVDETTYMFSPKVLDRANVIEFNQIYLDGFSEKEENNFQLKNADVRASLLTDGVTSCSIEDYKKAGKIVNVLPELIQRLEKYHLHFGYRVANEISRFMWLAQEMVHDFQADTALDIQLLQKVLPKFHGTRAKLDKPLQELLTFCYDSDPNKSIDISEEKIKQAEQFDTSARFPRTAQKLARMLRNLREQGYASFIE